MTTAGTERRAVRAPLATGAAWTSASSDTTATPAGSSADAAPVADTATAARRSPIRGVRVISSPSYTERRQKRSTRLACRSAPSRRVVGLDTLTPRQPPPTSPTTVPKHGSPSADRRIRTDHRRSGDDRSGTSTRGEASERTIEDMKKRPGNGWLTTLVVMSQPPQCTYIGAGEGALRAPFEPPPTRRPRVACARERRPHDLAVAGSMPARRVASTPARVNGFAVLRCAPALRVTQAGAPASWPVRPAGVRPASGPAAPSNGSGGNARSRKEFRRTGSSGGKHRAGPANTRRSGRASRRNRAATSRRSVRSEHKGASDRLRPSTPVRDTPRCGGSDPAPSTIRVNPARIRAWIGAGRLLLRLGLVKSGTTPATW